MKDKPIAKCPTCGGKVKRLISAGGGVIFKGSGFYANDYAKSNSPACGRDRPCCGRDTPCNSE
jgi:predicted nucleic acid-binding Zn ribbon protein